MSIAWYWEGWTAGDRCSDPPEESCSDIACPLHGWPDVDDDLADEDEP
jgi:hypothetical protein